MKQNVPADRTNLIVALVAVAMAVVIGFSVMDNPEVMRRILPGPETPKSVAPTRNASSRGQPIVIPANRYLREEERRGIEWMAVPPLPPLPPSVLATPPLLPEELRSPPPVEEEAVPPGEPVPEVQEGGSVV